MTLTPPRAASTTPSIPRLFIAFVDPRDLAELSRLYDVIIWHNHPDLRRAAAELKRRKPIFKALMYRDLTLLLSRPDPDPLEQTTGNYQWILQQHPDWFLRDRAGRPIESRDYKGRWMMDPGHPGWRAYWIEQTLPDVIQGGWDGVFADDALSVVTMHGMPPLAKYPDDASLQQAMYEFLAQITEAFHKQGKLVIANVSNSYFYPGLWEQWLKVTDGLMEEHFGAQGWAWSPEVAQRQLEQFQMAARMNKWALAGTYGEYDDRERMGTSLAAYLTSAGPKTLWCYRPTALNVEPVWQLSWDLGLGDPVGEATVNGSVWRRDFERGVVLVNTGPQPATMHIASSQVRLKPRQGVVVGQWDPAPSVSNPAYSSP